MEHAELAVTSSNFTVESQRQVYRKMESLFGLFYTEVVDKGPGPTWMFKDRSGWQINFSPNQTVSGQVGNTAQTEHTGTHTRTHCSPSTQSNTLTRRTKRVPIGTSAAARRFQSPSWYFVVESRLVGHVHKYVRQEATLKRFCWVAFCTDTRWNPGDGGGIGGHRPTTN